jgi:hypothetical protein
MKRRALPACAVTVRKFWLVTPILMKLSCGNPVRAAMRAAFIDADNASVRGVAVIANAQSILQPRGLAQELPLTARLAS